MMKKSLFGLILITHLASCAQLKITSTTDNAAALETTSKIIAISDDEKTAEKLILKIFFEGEAKFMEKFSYQFTPSPYWPLSPANWQLRNPSDTDFLKLMSLTKSVTKDGQVKIESSWPTDKLYKLYELEVIHQMKSDGVTSNQIKARFDFVCSSINSGITKMQSITQKLQAKGSKTKISADHDKQIELLNSFDAALKAEEEFRLALIQSGTSVGYFTNHVVDLSDIAQAKAVGLNRVLASIGSKKAE